MFKHKLALILLASIILSSISNVLFAATEHSVKFFASNNTSEIDMPTAYQRLIGTQQAVLQVKVLAVMGKHFIQQVQIENDLGVYRLSSDQNITADNTEDFYTPADQPLSDERIFTTAKDLAIALNQESVAVFIPDQVLASTNKFIPQPTTFSGDLSITFQSHQPNVNEVMTLLHEKLPANYSESFTIHLINNSKDFNSAKVTKIEWLGSNFNLDDIKNAFPNEKMAFNHGTAYLVYQNGQKTQI